MKIVGAGLRACPRTHSAHAGSPYYTLPFRTCSAMYSEVRQASAMMESVGFLSALEQKGAPSVTNKVFESQAWQ